MKDKEFHQMGQQIDARLHSRIQEAIGTMGVTTMTVRFKHIDGKKYFLQVRPLIHELSPGLKQKIRETSQALESFETIPFEYLGTQFTLEFRPTNPEA